MLLLIASALAATPSAPGDVVITEILMDATSPLSDLEWYELHAPGASMDLDGCWQVEGHWEGESWKGTEYEIPRTADSATVPAGGYSVISKNTNAVNDDPTYAGDTVCVAYDTPDDTRTCVAESIDIFSGSVYLGASGVDVETLCILCGGSDTIKDVDDACNNPGDWTVIDSVDFDATLLEGCPLDDNACSINLDPGTVDATANDDMANWCIPTTSYYDPAFNGAEAAAWSTEAPRAARATAPASTGRPRARWSSARSSPAPRRSPSTSRSTTWPPTRWS